MWFILPSRGSRIRACLELSHQPGRLLTFHRIQVLLLPDVEGRNKLSTAKRNIVHNRPFVKAANKIPIYKLSEGEQMILRICALKQYVKSNFRLINITHNITINLLHFHRECHQSSYPLTSHPYPTSKSQTSSFEFSRT